MGCATVSLEVRVLFLCWPIGTALCYRELAVKSLQVYLTLFSSSVVDELCSVQPFCHSLSCRSHQEGLTPL